MKVANELVITLSSPVKLPFLIKLNEPGMYHVVFSATQLHEESKRLIQSGGHLDKFTLLSIQASDYIASD